MKPQYRVIDLSSIELHINIDCPICGHIEMKKVDDKTHITQCSCMIEYTMRKNEDDSICISFSIPIHKN